MTTLQNIPAPPVELTNEHEPASVAVHLGFPTQLGYADLFGCGGPMPVLLLAHILTAALRREGHLSTSERFPMCGELADAAGLHEFADSVGAADCIVRELSQSVFASRFQVAVRKAGHWRSVFPTSDEILDGVFDWDRIGAAHSVFMARIRDQLAEFQTIVRGLRASLAIVDMADKQGAEAIVESLEQFLAEFSAYLKIQDQPGEAENPS